MYIMCGFCNEEFKGSRKFRLKILDKYENHLKGCIELIEFVIEIKEYKIRDYEIVKEEIKELSKEKYNTLIDYINFSNDECLEKFIE